MEWNRAGRIARAVLMGLLVGGLLSVPAVRPIDAVGGLQLSAGDALLANEKGPGLGFFAHRPDVVIVSADVATSDQLSGQPTALDDVQLYTFLLAAGAKAIGDPRPIVDSTDAVAVVHGLEEVPGSSGRVFRNIAIAASAPPVLTDTEKMDYVGADLLYTDAATDVNHSVRYYPLIGQDADGHFDETLVLKLARVALGVPLTSSALLEARNAGILGLWARLTAAPANLPPLLRDAEGVAPSAYPIGAGHQVTWVDHPSVDLPDTVFPAAIWIKYRSAPAQPQQYTYPHFSYVDVLEHRVPASAFSGKVVLVDDAGSGFPVPTASRNQTRAEIDAQVFDEVMDGAYLQPEPPLAVVSAILLLALAGALTFALLGLTTATLATGAVLAAYLVGGVLMYRSGTFPDLVLAPAALVLASVAGGGWRYVQETLERRRIYDLFGRYVPRSVVAELVRRPAERALALEGDKRELTVLFADVRGFSGFSERLAPEDLLRSLNTVLQLLVRAAFEEQGTVDKYIGDAVMVLFNAPLEQPDHALRAVRAAQRMQEAMTGNELSVGIGIHCGLAVVGNVGTAERLEYTAIGGTVNLAARLCESAGRGDIVISQEVRDAIGDAVDVETRPISRVKGIDRDLVTYRVRPPRPGGDGTTVAAAAGAVRS